MLTGTVHVLAEVAEPLVTFPAVEFDPRLAGVERATVETEDGGKAVRAAVTFAAVGSVEDAQAGAALVAEAVLDRLSFRYNLAAAPARVTGPSLVPLDPTAGGRVLYAAGFCGIVFGTSAVLRAEVSPETLRPVLEDPAPAGERHFGLFRSALRSGSPVEQYMHLYNLLLMRHEDRQKAVEEFIASREPDVPKSEWVRRAGEAAVEETVYTRLRNEFGHHRPGVDVEATKREMSAHLHRLRDLVRQAIESGR